MSDAVTTTYEELLARVDAWEARLQEAGVRAGDVVAFKADFDAASIALLLALAFSRRIAVPLASMLPEERLAARLDAAQVAYYASPATETIEKRGSSVARAELLGRVAASGEAGLVLFTSGSTGTSKVSVLSLDRLLANFREPRKALRTLAFLMIDHIGGINTLLATLASGGSVVAATGHRPDEICAIIQRHRVEVLPTSPTFLRLLLLSGMHERYDLSSLSLITYGTEPMPPSTLAAVHEAFPRVRLKQTYGLTELGIFRTQSKDPASLWLKLGGVEWRVHDGTLWLRSASAMLGYLNAANPFDAAGWYDTGDAVEVDGEYVRILGRASDLINVGGEKVYPAEVENVLMELDNVVDVVAHGHPSPVMGQVVVARVRLEKPEDRDTFEARARAHCSSRLDAFKVPVVFKTTLEPIHTDRFKKARKQVTS